MRTFEAKISLDKFPIIIGTNIFDNLNAFLKNYSKNNIFIICDNYFKDNINFYTKSLSFIYEYKNLFIDGGLESKTIESYKFIIKELVKENISRDGIIVAIGGGVIGDLSAFVASTYQRGIDLVHIPTTTTAMIDSSIVGKTGINHLEQVNLIGSYHNPKAIFMDLRLLESLNDRDYYSGICEAIKMSVTSDKEMFLKFLDIDKLVSQRNLDTLEGIIYWSVLTKLKHVSNDYKEKSMRLILNYGHTFGQAIETYYGLYQEKLKHGEAISLGISVASKISHLLFNNEASKNLLLKTQEIINKYNLPDSFNKLDTSDIPEIKSLIKNLLNDKKRISEGNRFIICESIGNAKIKLLSDENILIKGFEHIY